MHYTTTHATNKNYPVNKRDCKCRLLGKSPLAEQTRSSKVRFNYSAQGEMAQ
jgi:hypothetical protein